MFLVRVGPEGSWAVESESGERHLLRSDPFTTPPGRWKVGEAVGSDQPTLAPAAPGQIVGVGRSFAAHARERGFEPPAEPIFFLKATSSVVGPGAPIVLPPESEQVEHEGEVAVILRRPLRRADPEEALAAVLGVTCACDVTARDLQRRDGSFSGAKSFDGFCPLGPRLLVGADLGTLVVSTRVNGALRQSAPLSQLSWSIPELLARASRRVSFSPGDVFLTGTPAGVGPLRPGDRVEVEVSGVGVLSNPVRSWPES